MQSKRSTRELARHGNRKKTLGALIRRDKQLMLMFAPVFVYYMVFCYLPMAGLVMAFEDFRIGSGFMGLFTSPFVGLKWFQQFFSSIQIFENGIDHFIG